MTASKAKMVTGKVVSSKPNKTIIVMVENMVKHPILGKIIRTSRKLHAHDAENACGVGDMVKIKEVRPISKNKCWTLVEVLTKAAIKEAV